MKKTFATILLAGSTLALAACDTTATGNMDTQPPYGLERTASVKKAPVVAPAVTATPTRTAPAERVFQRAQTK